MADRPANQWSHAVPRQPLLWAFCAMALGIVLHEGHGGSLAAGGFALAVLLGWLLAALRARKGVVLLCLGIFAAVGYVNAALQAVPAPMQFACASTDSYRLEGVFRLQPDAPVERRRDPATGRLMHRTEATLLAQRCGDVWEPLQGRISLSLFGERAPFRGQTLEAKLRLTPLQAQLNPTFSDPDIMSRHRRVQGRAYSVGNFAPVHAQSGWWAAIDRMRARTADNFERQLEARVAALLKALTMADRADISVAQRDAFGAAGIAHLLAISGLHVGLLAVGLYFLAYGLLVLVPGSADRFSLPPLAAGVTIPCVVLFCIWVGAPASAVRATIMTVAVLCAQMIGRPKATMNALGMAGILILLVSPTSVYDIGFLLSFSAVVALLLMPAAPQAWPVPVRYVWSGLLASTLSTIATVPILVNTFGQVPWISTFSNLIAVPIGGMLATPLALLAMLTSWMWEAAGNALMHVAAYPALWLNALATALAPFGAIDVPAMSNWEILLYYAACLGGLLAQGSRRYTISLVLVALLGASLVLRHTERFRSDALRVIVPYVGQGDGILVIFPGGEVLLMDAGGAIEEHGWDPGRGAIAPLLRRMGIRTLDKVVISHPHPDHINGLDYISEHFPIRELWYPGTGEEVAQQQRVIDRVQRQGGRPRLAVELPAEMSIAGVQVGVLHPRPADSVDGLPYFPEMHFNDNSIVMSLRYGARSILLTGDIEHDAEEFLRKSFPEVDILKSPHHGSDTSSTPVLLDAVRAKLAVISCGVNNRFRFPRKRVLQNYEEYNMRVLRTDLDGMIDMRTDGQAWVIRTMMGAALRCAEHCEDISL